jgi:subtilisin-like proprotein convertase family protein
VGNIEKVTVTINGFTHTYPNDVVLLLVSPKGIALPLMGNDGGGVSVTNLTLTFDDAGPAATLATSTAITNGTYKTGNNATGVTFPAPAPAANASSLTVFSNLPPSDYTNTWSLYVLDDSTPETGAIASWSLNIYTKPAIVPTNTAVTLNENSSTNITFTVSDSSSNEVLTPTITLADVDTINTGYTNAEGAYSNFIDTNNVPADFTFTTPINPNGPTTLTIKPNANLYGNAKFTINLTDSTGATVSTPQITLTVNPVVNSSVAPAILLPTSPFSVTTGNEVATTTNLISLVSTAGGPGSGLVFSVLATNGIGNVGVNSNVFISTAGLPFPATEGRTNSFYFSIVPGGFPVGTNYLNFIATDPFVVPSLSTTTAVAVVVAPLTNGPLAGPLVYVNTNSLNLAAGAHGSLTISLTNLINIGSNGSVTVSILGLTNSVVDGGLSVALLAPDQQTLVQLIHDSTGFPISSPDALTYAEITFADSDGFTNVAVDDVLPTGLPTGTILTNYVLNAEGGTNSLTKTLSGVSPTNSGIMNEWTLLVTNNSTSPLGISGGWALDFYPAPVIQFPLTAITIPESASTNVVIITADRVGHQSSLPTVTFSPNPTPTYSDTVLAATNFYPIGTTETINGTNYTVGSAIVGGTNYTTNILKLTGNTNEAGTATLTVTVTEINGQTGTIPNTFTATNNFTLTVTFVAQPPSISFIENQVTFAGDPILNIPFTISSPDLNANSLSISVVSGNQAVLPTLSYQDNAVVTTNASSGPAPLGLPSTADCFLSLFPIGKGGNAPITVYVSDGTNTVSTSFLLVVGAAGGPLYPNPTNITLTALSPGSPYPSTNVVSGLVGKVENVIVTVFDVTEKEAGSLNLILVGPTNATGQPQPVYLMGGAGVGTSMNSVDLVFSNSLPSGTEPAPLPEFTSISSDVYSPTNYGSYTTDAPAPAPPHSGTEYTSYGNNLVTSFSGSDPNGVWSLYAFDKNGAPAGGYIYGGWQLSIITGPKVSPTTNIYYTLENISTNIVIPVGDAESGDTSLTVTTGVTPVSPSTATSITIASPVQVTNNGVENLAVLQIMPKTYKFGTNSILITASDASGVMSTATITFIVISNSQPPVISTPSGTTFSTPAGVAITDIPFEVWDAQTTNANTFVVSSSGTLSPAPSISIITNGTADDGTNNYFLDVAPSGVGTGTNTVTVSVTDGVGKQSKVQFTIAVTPNLAYISTSPASITLGPGYPAYSLASAYPWSITVPPDVAGLVSGVKVSLIGFTHNDASDVQVLLVSPSGSNVVLMANAGDQSPVSDVNLEFSQSAGPLIPVGTPLTNGTYRPDNYATGLVFSNPPGITLAAPPYSTDLNIFNGETPSGTWSLYIMDTAYPDSGSISDWILFLTTGPAIQAISTPQFVYENTTNNVPLVITDVTTPLANLTVTATSSNPNLTLTVQGVGTASGPTNLQIVPALNYPSAVQGTNATNTVTVTVSDPSLNTAVSIFTNIVVYVAQYPVVSASTNNLVMLENTSAQISFTNSDVDAYLYSTNINLISTDPALATITGTNITGFTSPLTPDAFAPFLSSVGVVTYTVTAVSDVFGTNLSALVYTAGNTNGETTTNIVALSVVHVIQLPTIAPFFTGTEDIVPGTTSTNIPFYVTNLEPNANLTITAVSSAPSEVPNSPANIVINPASFPNASPGTYSGYIQLVVPSGATPQEGSTITVTVTQVVPGGTNTAAAAFSIFVESPTTTVFANTNTIANSATNPVPSPYGTNYGSTNIVSGLTVGSLFTASVTLNTLTATDPSDVSILLEAPNGTSVLLLSAAGGTVGSTNLTLTFADTDGSVPASGPLAPNGTSTNYHPAGYNGNTNALPSNAPAPPYYDRMAVFSGLTGANLNGPWILWVVDNTLGQTVSIANGWSLSIATGPEIVLDPTQLSDLSVPLTITENGVGQDNTGMISFHLLDSTGGGAGDKVTITSSPAGMFSPYPVPYVTNAPAGIAYDYIATFTPALFSNGSGTITFTVSNVDGATGSTNYPFVISKANFPPTLTRLPNITTNENSVSRSEFFVTQFGDPLSDITVAAYSASPLLVTNGGLSFSTGVTAIGPALTTNTNVLNLTNFPNFASSVHDAADIILNITPVSGAVGTATIDVYVTNADSIGSTFIESTFTVTLTPQTFAPQFGTNNFPPTGGFISVIGGDSANLIFSVTSQDATPPVIIVTATNQSAPDGVTLSGAVSSGGSGLYNGTDANLPGSVWTVAINTLPTPVLVKSTIQLTATDAHGLQVTTNFQVHVVPSEQHYYSNSAPINIVDVSPSIPSPSIISVSGLVGTLSQVVVQINGFAHQYPSDVGILLVGPNGSNTVLMNNAGDGVSVGDIYVSGLTLTFSQSNAVGPAPPSSQLFSETYLPSDGQPVKPYNFETNGPFNTPVYNATNPAPPLGPYPTNLNVFNGLNPNTNWYLYVQDDSAGDVGYITSGWTLEIFTTPNIGIIGPTNLTVQYPGPTKASFVIYDDSSASAINYTTNSFGVTSTNAALIPPANVTFSGIPDSTNWTAFFTPALNEAGTSLVTIYATNSYGQVASASLLVTVTPVDIGPDITLPTNGATVTITAGTPVIIPLGYYDTGFPTNSVIISASSTPLGGANPVPNSSLSFLANGTGPSNLYVTPVGDLTGTNLITLTATQPIASNALSTNSTFTLVVVPSTIPIFANTGPITISADPSQIGVSNVGSGILKVTATLVGFTHNFPSDVSILLVGPGTNNQSVMLMSDEGGFIPVSNLRFTFDDILGTAMSPSGPLESGTNAPALSDLNYLDNRPDVILPNAPTNSPPNSIYFHDLGVFSNTSPNGIWSLYAYDPNTFDVGEISGGWSLAFENHRANDYSTGASDNSREFVGHRSVLDRLGIHLCQQHNSLCGGHRRIPSQLGDESCAHRPWGQATKR